MADELPLGEWWRIGKALSPAVRPVATLVPHHQTTSYRDWQIPVTARRFKLLTENIEIIDANY
jgi:hypothetical protein